METPVLWDQTQSQKAVCRRLLNEQQISVNRQMDAMTLRNQELEAELRRLNNGTITTANTSHSSLHRQPNQDQQSVTKDAQGRKWFQVKFCCSKHGFNTGH